MENQDLEPVELLVLRAIDDGGASLDLIAERSGQPLETVAAAYHRLVRDGLVETTDEGLRVTDEARSTLGGVRTDAGSPVAADLEAVARNLGTAFAAHARERAASAETARNAVLASDADRDTAVGVLAEAYSHGRLTSSELEQRTGRALSARTHGDLDDLLAGLGGYRPAPPHHPVRKSVFVALAVLGSPFVLLGTLFLLGGEDLGDRGLGVLLLLLVLPGLLKLRRWAWPRR